MAFVRPFAMAVVGQTLADIYLSDGREVIVRYVGEPHTHRRIIIRPGSGDLMPRYSGARHSHQGPVRWILTPDNDLYPEELSVPPLKGLTPTDSAGIPLPDLAVGSPAYLYRVHDFETLPRPLSFLELLREANRVEELHHSGAVVAVGGAAAAQAEIAPEWMAVLRQDKFMAGSGILPGAAGSWREAGTTNSVSTADHWVLYDTRGLCLVGGRPMAIVKNEVSQDQGLPGVSDKKDDDDDDGETELDARVLSIKRNSSGVRHRDFRSAVEDLSTTEWGEWPVGGPRTTEWVCRFIANGDGHPRGRHAHWRRDAGLGASDAGVAEHELAMKALEYAVEYDQVNVGELASMELMVRKAQLIELRHKDKVLSGLDDDYTED